MAAAIRARARLRAVVEEAGACAGELEQALESERLALREQDSDALHAAAQAKRARTMALAALEEKRLALCRDCGLPADLTQSPPPSDDDPENRLAGSWRRLLRLAERCAELNRTNGRIINLRRRQVTEALHIIGGGRPETYGPGSGKDVTERKRAIARA